MNTYHNDPDRSHTNPDVVHFGADDPRRDYFGAWAWVWELPPYVDSYPTAIVHVGLGETEATLKLRSYR